MKASKAGARRSASCHCATTRRAVETLIAPLCIGKDPREIARPDGRARRANCTTSAAAAPSPMACRASTSRSGTSTARSPASRSTACSPTTTVTDLPAYASLLRYGDRACGRTCGRSSPVSRGFTNIKIHEIGTAEVAAARAAIGPGIPLTVDMNCPWTCDDALKMAEAWKPYDVFWMEEPIWPPDDFSAMAKFAAKSPIRLAAGENAGSPEEFERLMDIGKVAFVQPSVTKVGGISEMIRIIEAAKSRGVDGRAALAVFRPGPHGDRAPDRGLAAVVIRRMVFLRSRRAALRRRDRRARDRPRHRAAGAGAGPRPGLGCDPEVRAVVTVIPRHARS